MVGKAFILRYLAVLLVSSCLARAGLHDSGAFRNVSEHSSTASTKIEYFNARNSSPIVYGGRNNETDVILHAILPNDSYYMKDIGLQTRSQLSANVASGLSSLFPKYTKLQKPVDSNGLRGSGEEHLSRLQSSPSDKTVSDIYRRKTRPPRGAMEIPQKRSQQNKKHSTSHNTSSASESRLDIVSLTVRNNNYVPQTRNNDLFSKQASVMREIGGEEEPSSHQFEDRKQNFPSTPVSLDSQSAVTEIHRKNQTSVRSNNKKHKFNPTATSFQWKANIYPPGSEGPKDSGQESGLREESVKSLGHTTSHREAIVRASLVTEDRNFHLKMLPRNKMVGLTLKPNTRHRLLFPVERSGFLSISLAPCGHPVTWSLTLRSLPPEAASEEALSREGQDTMRPATDHETRDTESIEHNISEPDGGRRGVVMLASRRGESDELRPSLVAPGRELDEQTIHNTAADIAITKKEKGARPMETGLSENDDLFREIYYHQITSYENFNKLTQMDVPHNNSKSENYEHFGTTSGIGNRRQGRILFPEDTYKQSDSLRSILSDEFRKTNHNVYSLKNLAYDIERSDFFDNELNRIRYHREYEEGLRTSRERRDSRARFVSTNKPIGTPVITTALYHQKQRTRCEANDSLCSKVRYLSSDTVSEEIWFEDPVHSNWLDGNYRDDSQIDSTHFQVSGDALYSISNRNDDNLGDAHDVVFLLSRHKSRLRKSRSRFKVLDGKYKTPYSINRNSTNRPNEVDAQYPNWSSRLNLKYGTSVGANFTRPRRGIPFPMAEHDDGKKGVRSPEMNMKFGMNLHSKSLVNSYDSVNYTEIIVQNANGTDTAALRPSAYIILDNAPRLIPSESIPREQSNLLEMRLSETTSVPVPAGNNTTTLDPLLRMTIRDIIKSIWKRPKLKTSMVLQVKESNVSEEQDIASTTIWGRSSSYDELDSGYGDQVWLFQRRNATPGIYVITLSSGPSAVSLQALASVRPFASYYKPLPVTAMVSRRQDEPPILTVSWLTSKESSQTKTIKRIQRHREREQQSLQEILNRRLVKMQHARKSLFEREARKGDQRPPTEGARDHTASGGGGQGKRRGLQVMESDKGGGPSASDRGDFLRETYCLALSEVKPHVALCGARASREVNLRLGCTRQTHYSLPLAPQVYRDDHHKKRYYVTVWQPGSLMPLGQTTLRGSGRGRIPRLRQGVLHRILLSAGGAATARFRVRRSKPRLHVAAVSCRGGLTITVRKGGPRGLRVVRVGGHSALILAVHNPPKGLLHLTVTPSTPHTAHTFLIAAATSARRLPFPRLPQSLSVQAEVSSCRSGRLSWRSAPGRPKYCVLLQEVEGRPKIAWPPRQCGWDRLLSDPASLTHCSVGYGGRRQVWELLRLKENTTYTVTVLVTHPLTNRSLALAPTVLTVPACP